MMKTHAFNRLTEIPEVESTLVPHHSSWHNCVRRFGTAAREGTPRWHPRFGKLDGNRCKGSVRREARRSFLRRGGLGGGLRRGERQPGGRLSTRRRLPTIRGGRGGRRV